MKRFYLLLLFSLFITLGQANPSRGYVITKNGMHLTGSIGKIYHSNFTSEVVFTNDLGTTYSYSPGLISGFVFEQDSTMFFYESKVDQGRWFFFQVLEKGMGMNLYKSPTEKVKLYVQDGIVDSYSYKSTEYWIEVKGRHPVRINRWNFRKKMRRLLRNLAPELSQKIGTPGYRFKNLEEIVSECNQKFRPGSKLI